ncbi:MAG TPA: VWA domain-containing protein [Acidimicrobiales bacterium]|nr:VWA domain-containing protein [Acidimicrobiales bacterium]
MSGGEVPRFPFSAVVGHDDLKLALLLNAVDPAVGGVLLRGHKGSAKSTLARALAGLLPGDAPFTELPVGATEDRLIGTLDLAAALTGGELRFQRGLLAAAHGGVLYVDEVNLLPDHLVDVLLDVAASGVNLIEREGVSHAHASRFVLIGSMNPEEGDLRPQLLDRFGLAVDVVTSADPAERAEAVRRRLGFDADPDRFVATWGAADRELKERLATVRPATVPDELISHVSRVCAALGAEGLRSDLTICRAAAALAGWEGRPSAGIDDVRRVAPLALVHRRRRGPLESPGIDGRDLDRAIDEADATAGGATPGRAPQPGDDARPEDGPAGGDRHERTEPDLGEPEGAEEAGSGGDAERLAEPAPGAPAPPAAWWLRPDGRDGRPLDTPAPGRRSAVEGPRGRLVADRAPDGPVRSLALGATVRAAAGRHAVAGGSAGALVEPGDLREAVREQRAGNLVVLVVDASGSMGADRRMEAAKGAVLSLLLDAYQRRDLVAMVTFRGDGAHVVLKPTGSVEVARARLSRLATGGRTPIAAGLVTALDLATSPARAATHRPLLVLVTDGRSTSAPAGIDPVAAAADAARAVRRRGVSAVVIDAEDGPGRLGLARELADAMGARYLTVPELTAGSLDAAVRDATVRRSSIG